MIRTKDLVCFMEIRVGKTFRYEEIDKEYVQEIIKRLRGHDKLKEGIEKIDREKLLNIIHAVFAFFESICTIGKKEEWDKAHKQIVALIKSGQVVSL